MNKPMHEGATLRGCAAPAKLNLFLHVTGRRDDGYHLLQTVFQLIDWGDSLDFTRRDDGVIRRLGEVEGVPADTDLCVRAARGLQAATGCRFGVDITLDKRLPAGAGLGGGSSDAATTLLALNRLWGLGLDRAALMALGLRLGADVPFFVFGANAFAEGVGEALQAVALPPRHFVVVAPPVHVPTVAIFGTPTLTRDTERVKMSDFIADPAPFAFGRNDLQPVAEAQYAEISQALDWLRKHDRHARMTGSGSCVFASFADRQSAETVAAQARQRFPQGWRAVAVAGLDRHPLADFA